MGILVIGGSNVDICGRSEKVLVPHDSNPGVVSLSAGGVGHNIAMNLAHLGEDVTFLTALGDDEYGSILQDEMARTMNLRTFIPPFPGRKSGVYLYVNDQKGDLKDAVNDMSINDLLTPHILSPYISLMQDADLVVAEANLPSDTLSFIASHASRLVVDPVSTIKMKRIDGIWPSIEIFKPNRKEAEILSGVQISDEASLQKACGKMLDLGLSTVVVSLESDGAALARKDCFLRLSNPKDVKVVSTTGAGDAFVAGFCYGMLFERGDGFSLACALTSASIALGTEETVPSILSAPLLIAKVADTYEGVINEPLS